MKQAQLDLLRSIAAGLSRGSDEMLRVSPTDAMHPPSCALAIRDAADEIERLRADLATQQGCCDGAAAQDAHVRQEREDHRAEVERLREAAEDALWFIGTEYDRVGLHKAGKSWRSTKDGAAYKLRAALKEDGR